MRRLLAALTAAVLLTACGEPAVDVQLPAREPGQAMVDAAGVLDAQVEERLRAVDGRDIVALTYETGQASAGEARRAGQRLVREWNADVALVAVAAPGGFASTDGERERFFGIEPAESFAVPGSLREEIVEEVIPPIARGNDWPRVFVTAVDALEEGLS